MSYFLCRNKCFKGYLLYRGYVFKSDIPGKYLISLSIQGKPEGEILTFVNGSIILANNDEYDRNRKLIDKDYEGVYKTGKEFFVVRQKGQSAFLKMVSKAEAEEIYYRMPRIVKNQNVFLSPEEVHQRNVKNFKDILAQAESERPQREYEERVREAKKEPYWWITNPWLEDDTADIIR